MFRRWPPSLRFQETWTDERARSYRAVGLGRYPKRWMALIGDALLEHIGAWELWPEVHGWMRAPADPIRVLLQEHRYAIASVMLETR
ncbi:Hypothetical protein SMAX5B_011513 [Scophthalmus maximus]|uniref:Uncharacterized protein n=1 Tax=Scophthalmus maximus TaxID=52904 RepID=A0A2U9BMA7_SCOMX|nr:Hypothetical protein SMAX5B_011513 [Scophthalmus maximus]